MRTKIESIPHSDSGDYAIVGLGGVRVIQNGVTVWLSHEAVDELYEKTLLYRQENQVRLHGNTRGKYCARNS